MNGSRAVATPAPPEGEIPRQRTRRPGRPARATSRRRRGSSSRSRPTRTSMKMPNPEVIIATVRSAVAATTRPAPGLPVEQQQRPEAERGGADEPDLHRPEQVLEAAPEERDDDRDQRPRARAGRPAGEDVDLEHDDHVEEREQRQVRHVRTTARPSEHQPVDDLMTPSQCSLNGWRKLSSEIVRSAMTAHSSAKKVRPRPSHRSVAKAASDADPDDDVGQVRAAPCLVRVTVAVVVVMVAGLRWWAMRPDYSPPAPERPRPDGPARSARGPAWAARRTRQPVMTSIATDPAIPTPPRSGPARRCRASGGIAAITLSVKTTPNATAEPADSGGPARAASGRSARRTRSARASGSGSRTRPAWRRPGRGRAFAGAGRAGSQRPRRATARPVRT